ncbi:MAG TPA: regulator SirB [Chromatiales bacterium]|nr:regulator SirB [Chromatiales bacterium]
MFTTLKTIHISAVALTATLFVLRGYWLFSGSPLLNKPVVRVAPHVNDTILFFSALGMAYLLGQYPFVNGWLTAKLLALILYIVLGHIALKRARSTVQRITAFTAALLTLAYIVGVALCHNPLTCLAA